MVWGDFLPLGVWGWFLYLNWGPWGPMGQGSMGLGSRGIGSRATWDDNHCGLVFKGSIRVL